MPTLNTYSAKDTIILPLTLDNNNNNTVPTNYTNYEIST